MGKELKALRFPFIEDAEVLGGQVRNEAAFFIGNGDRHDDFVDLNLDAGVWRLLGLRLLLGRRGHTQQCAAKRCGSGPSEYK
jgi:hypothetical protein